MAPRIKTINLNNLIPIEKDLNLKTLKDWAKSKLLPFPEVFLIDDKNYISDGHHRVSLNYLRGNQLIPIKYFTPENCKKSPAYKYACNLILEKRKIAEVHGINHINDLRINF